MIGSVLIELRKNGPASCYLMQNSSRSFQLLMAVAPLAPAVIGMIAGIIIDDRFRPNSWAYALPLVAATGLAAFRRIRGLSAPILVLLASTGAGGLLHWSHARFTPRTSIRRIADRNGRIVRLRGVVASMPRLLENREGPFSQWQFRSEETAFLADVSEMEADDEWVPVSGKIRVTIRESVFDLRDGEQVELFGWLVALIPPMNPGAFDWREYYLRQGVVARMYVDQRENVVRRGESPHGIRRLVEWMRTESRGLLTSDLATGAPEEASFLEAMVLGHRSRFDRKLNETFTRAGCVHFVAVSGTNIVVLMGAVWFGCRLLGLNRRRSAWAMAAIVILYTALAEPRPPVLRACVMGLFFCSALLLRRTGSHFNWICGAAIVLCVFDPSTVFDVGFQLSFAAVLGVAYLSPAIAQFTSEFYWWTRCTVLRDPFARADEHLRMIAAMKTPLDAMRRIGRIMWGAVRVFGATFAVSLAAWACGLPITAIYFQRVQLWGAPNSMLVYPLMSAVMILGLLKVVAAGVSPTLAVFLTGSLRIVDSFLIGIVDHLADLPGASVLMWSPPWWLVASFYVLVLSFAVRFRRRRTVVTGDGEDAVEVADSGARRSGWVCLGSAVVLCASSVAWCGMSVRADKLVVTVLSVGAGSATVIELPNGDAMLFDAGSLTRSDLGESAVIPFLRNQNIRNIDSIFVSHPNLDHFSGVPTIVAEVPTGSIIVNHCFGENAESRSSVRRLLELLVSGGRPFEVLNRKVRSWEQGGVRFEFLWPSDADCDGLKANDSSTVLRLSYAGQSLLLTGDVEDAAQRRLIERGGLGADVLVLPHHGSVRPTTVDFVKAVGADVYIRSSGQRSERTDNGLMEIIGGAPLFNTADVGAVRVEIDHQGIRVSGYLD